MPLRISLLSSNAILLDGKPVQLPDLDTACETAKANNDFVLYYRENPQSEPSSVALQVMQLVVKWKLPISLSSQPDFSDYVDSFGQRHPRTDIQSPPVAAADRFAPRMPDVDLRPEVETVFANARKMSAGGSEPGPMVIVRPNRKALVVPRLPDSSERKAMSDAMGRLIPAAVKRNIAAIANTGFAGAGPDSPPSLSDANQCIPFFGILIGLSYIGHHVWIFEGHASALSAGCREADILIVDSGMAALLSPAWQNIAAQSMRNPNIWIHDRKTARLLSVRKAGTGPNLEFPA